MHHRNQCIRPILCHIWWKAAGRVPSFATATCLLLLMQATSLGQDVVYLQPPAEFSKYRLAPLTEEADSFPGRRVLVVKWQRQVEAAKTGRLAGQTKSGPLSVMGIGGFRGASGTERIRNLFSSFRNGVNQDIAIWIEATAYGNRRFLLSNVVRRGNPGATPKARPMTPAEQAEYREHIRVTSPPKDQPPQHRPLLSTSVLRPGMLLKAAHQGAWGDAEVLAVDPRAGVTVRLIDHHDLIVLLQPKGWLSVPNGKIESVPGGPTLRVLPGTKTEVPADAELLSSVTDSVAGMPVKFSYMQKLWDGFLIDRRGANARVRYEFANRQHEKDVSAATVVVEKLTLDQLRRPGIASEMAKNLEEQNAKAALAIADRGYRCLYTGVDLSGWKTSNDSGWESRDWNMHHKSEVMTTIETQEQFDSIGFIVDFAPGETFKSGKIQILGMEIN
ncbi:MAG: hypothetical protein AAGJ83_10800, partial [Planctomycetota bacterium]